MLLDRSSHFFFAKWSIQFGFYKGQKQIDAKLQATLAAHTVIFLSIINSIHTHHCFLNICS